MGLSLWSLWGSQHDKTTMDREQEADSKAEAVVENTVNASGPQTIQETKSEHRPRSSKRKTSDYSRSRSRRRTITDEHQTENTSGVNENTPVAELIAKEGKNANLSVPGDQEPHHSSTDDKVVDGLPSIVVRTPTIDESERRRPKAGGIAFPFSLKNDGTSASMKTLTSDNGVSPAQYLKMDEAKESGVQQNAIDDEALGATGGRETGPATDEVIAGKENGKAVVSA